jgi:hypothetical protein
VANDTAERSINKKLWEEQNLSTGSEVTREGHNTHTHTYARTHTHKERLTSDFKSPLSFLESRLKTYEYVCSHGNAVNGFIYKQRHLDLSNCSFSIHTNISQQLIHIEISEPILIDRSLIDTYQHISKNVYQYNSIHKYRYLDNLYLYVERYMLNTYQNIYRYISI